jgi:hypothetical protein
MEGWYQDDAKRMKARLHRSLAKRSLEERSGGERALRRTSASDMVSNTQSGYGVGLWRDGCTAEVRVLEMFKDIATAVVVAAHYMEYLHQVKTGERWVIVYALMKRRPRRPIEPIFKKMGVNGLMIDYRGYGKSTGRIKKEQDVYTDGGDRLEFLNQ